MGHVNKGSIPRLSVTEGAVQSLCEKPLVSVRPPPRFLREFRGRGRRRERAGLSIRVFFTQALHGASMSPAARLSLNIPNSWACTSLSVPNAALLRADNSRMHCQQSEPCSGLGTPRPALKPRAGFGGEDSLLSTGCDCGSAAHRSFTDKRRICERRGSSTFCRVR